jgi:hypothetical protein
VRKKKSRRSEAKYPALDPQLNLKTRFEQLDIDYLDQLPESWTDPKTGKKWSGDQLKQYLNDFTNEHVHADFTTNKKRVHKKKRVESERNKDLKSLTKNIALKNKEFVKEIKFKKKELLETINKNIKEFITILKDSNTTVSTKNKLKKIINKTSNKLKKQILEEYTYFDNVNELKDELKKQISGEFSYIEDVYKKEAEHKNNARNRCILTRAKAQGKALGIDDISESYYVDKNEEDEMIARIDELNLMKKLEKSDGDADDS